VTETNVFELTQPGTFSDPLTEVLRNGARTLLGPAVEAGVQAARAWSRGAAIRRRHFLASGNMEKIGDLIVYRQEFVDLPWRFVPLHDPLSSPRRLMRILRPISALCAGGAPSAGPCPCALRHRI
jgi:hypothetical protein